MLDLNKLYLLDCMEGMVQFPDNYFDLAIVDPPYGIGEKGQRNKTGDRPTIKWKNPSSQKYKPFNDNKGPDREYFSELFRISESQISWGDNHFTTFSPCSSGWIVWDKKVSEKERLSMCELAYTSFNKRCVKYEFLWAGFRKGKQEERFHPTQKPTDLYRWILRNYAKPGMKIIDTHVGSGSSIIAFLDFGCEWIGFEIDEDYHAAATKRIEIHKQRPKPFFTDSQLINKKTSKQKGFFNQ